MNSKGYNADPWWTPTLTGMNIIICNWEILYIIVSYDIQSQISKNGLKSHALPLLRDI